MIASPEKELKFAASTSFIHRFGLQYAGCSLCIDVSDARKRIVWVGPTPPMKHHRDSDVDMVSLSFGSHLAPPSPPLSRSSSASSSSASSSPCLSPSHSGPVASASADTDAKTSKSGPIKPVGHYDIHRTYKLFDIQPTATTTHLMSPLNVMTSIGTSTPIPDAQYCTAMSANAYTGSLIEQHFHDTIFAGYSVILANGVIEFISKSSHDASFFLDTLSEAQFQSSITWVIGGCNINHAEILLLGAPKEHTK